MNEHTKERKVVIMSMASLLIGSLLYIFGLYIAEESLVPLFLYYIIALALYICAFLAVYNNNKKTSTRIYKYIMLLSLGFIILITIVSISYII